jgi:hypothetical protein
LKAASQRFTKRSFKQETLRESIENPAAEAVFDEDAGSQEPSRRSVGLLSSPDRRDSKMEVDPRSITPQIRPTAGLEERPEQSLVPVPSADDNFSHALLRPAVLSIMSKFDRTLVTLHHARNAGVRYDSDSATSSSEDDRALSLSSRARPPQRRSKKGGSMNSSSNSGMPQNTKQHQHASKGKGNGNGSSSDESTSEAVVSDVSMKEESERSSTSEHSPAGQHTSAKSRAKRKRQKPDSSKQRYEQERNLRKLGLRDWSEVIGAATLAGFPPQVIARAAQRCANLFGQSMTFQTISEGSRHMNSGSSRTINPGREPEPLSPDEETKETDSKLKRSLSRHRSRSRPNRTSRPRSGRASSVESTSSRKRRSSSVASQGGMWYCVFLDCRAALRGFTRRDNLVRHLRDAHGVDARGGNISQASQRAMQRETTAEEDNEDEEDLVEGLHVDGFLQPIDYQRGWRGADKVQRSRSRKRRAVSISSE